ncbi:tripartite tricarboxylate transporter substrate binding protein [Paralimibaculum aggregatum]|uniref:Tripartite tricarboxylate transporter substrate binding protein n=1 Tax=Paralimibaculum aggregatum TaxID=3036245 RepID=A0ABQ6LU70_9RHOB|nr:tripartite tricarboxylate transporter substrate binding protein [Limibaculum sp. NKW23]
MRNTARILACVAGLGAGAAQAFPDSTIEMIVPFGAGGGTDTVARLFEPEFSKALDGTIVIRNVVGASGSVGAATAAKARPDGYNIAYLPIGPASIQPLLRPGSYGGDSWEYICRTVNDPAILMVPADGNIASFDDFLKMDSIVYGSAGPGSVPHVAMAALAGATGKEAKHIPYKGTANAMNALAGGEIQIFADLPSVVKSFNVKPIAVFAAERHPSYPDVPTTLELGYDLQFSVWHGVFAPAGTDADKVDALAEACREAVNSPAFSESMAKVSTTTSYLDPEDFKAFVLKALETNEAVLKDAGLIQ